MSESRESRLMKLVDELEQAAQKVGLQVRREKILREVGYRARGGACRLRERDLLILDRDLPAHEQLDMLAQALSRRDLEAVYLSPAARRAIQDAAAGR
jgi:hypothetical protein